MAYHQDGRLAEGVRKKSVEAASRKAKAKMKKKKGKTESFWPS